MLLRDDARQCLASLHARGENLIDESCVVDPVPSGIPEGDPARSEAAAYERVREAHHEPMQRAALLELMFGKLPAALAAVGAGGDLLFNEHYVIKPALSAGRAGAHQLQ